MTPAVRFLEQQRVPFELMDYTLHTDVKIGTAAADALGLPRDQVFKTLIAQLDDGSLVCAVIPVAEQLNLKLVAKAAGVKSAQMADPKTAERSTGYLTGGISPFGQKKMNPVFLAAQALDFERIYVSGGKRGLEIAVATTDLIRCCHAEVCKLCRDA